MAKKKEETFCFEIEVEGKKYKCRRVVKGTRHLTQVIFVEGIPGYEHDQADYSRNLHDPKFMESFAETIAGSMIRKHLRAKNEDIDGP
jgi:hypothetical protein